MAGPSWLMDGSRIATKIKNAAGSSDLKAGKSKSNPTRTCPKCSHIIDNSDVSQDWPGLPRGVKFDPSDPELLWHLLAKVGKGAARPHPFIDEFIPTLEGGDGICCTHPRKLPGVKQDGSVSHFFHQTFKAYNTGTRKRRKIHNDDLGDVRWHKTGKTKPVALDGIQQGCKKIMVLYVSMTKGEKPEKTNWVMHQYHLGTGEDEKDGEYVVSKVFYQQQGKQNDRSEQDSHLEILNTSGRDNETAISLQLVTPESPKEKKQSSLDYEQSPVKVTEDHESEIKADITNDSEKLDENENHSVDDSKWWEGESQLLLDSQQLAEGIAICEEFLQSQSSYGGSETERNKPCLSDYARLGAEYLKRDLEECMKLSNIDNPDIIQDTPPDLQLSQLEFGSQDGLLGWRNHNITYSADK